MEFHAVNPHHVQIEASDKAIINYQKFDIGLGEHVQFIQPSESSTVLNRVTAKNPSQILGELSGNGRVFLVNPSGIYFGPTAVVNVGSFVASTLNISDEDFLNDKFHFYREPGSGQVVNEGLISASPEGFVALFAPFVENRGSIIARAGKVFLGSGEKVTLDFHGDGLIRFSVDGDLKDALNSSFAEIAAAGGAVDLGLRTANDAIKRVVNTDGITPAVSIVEVAGVIRLVGEGEIIADQIRAIGPRVEVSGKLDASNQHAGGLVHLLGDEVHLTDAHIFTNGETGGGEVLIGGDYQGKGEIRTARFTTMDPLSVIEADAKKLGNGGKVILWADDTTLFDGTIYARGIEKGGFVETSGKNELGVQLGYVNTLATSGQHGTWLLDPASINIVTGGGGTIAAGSAPNCATAGALSIAPATINASATNVALCAQNAAGSSITVTNAVSMTNAGVGLSLTAGSGSAGNINLNAGITTRGGAITLTGLVVLGAGVTLDTTNATPAGANVSFSNTLNGAQTLAINAGTGGVVTFTGAVGATTRLTSLSVTAGTITQSSTLRITGALTYTAPTAINIANNIQTTAGIVTITGPTTISGTPTIDTTNAGGTATGANIVFSGSTSTINGAVPLVLRAGTAGVTTLGGAIGGTTPLTNLTFTSAASISIGANISVTGANALTFPSPVNLTGTSNITNTNNITFSSTLNGAQALTISGATGTKTFTGAVGGTTPLTSLSATGATITQSSTVVTTGALSYTGPTAINVNGNITTSGGGVTMTGPIAITTTPTIDTTNAGGTAAGANITFSGSTSTINGATALTLRAGTGGVVAFGGAVGGTNALTNLTFTSAASRRRTRSCAPRAAWPNRTCGGARRSPASSPRCRRPASRRWRATPCI